MADELVYRLVLDGQADQPGSGQTPTTSSKPATSRSGEKYDPYEDARRRIRREDEAELADQAYRSIKQGKSLGQIQDADHQAKLDAWDEEQAAAREKARKEQERREDEANRRRIRDEERQERDEDWLARDELRRAKEEETRKEREAMERDRLQREANAKDPVWLASQALERQQLAEQTRLQMEATRQGVDPADIAQDERVREFAKLSAGRFQVAGNAVNQVMRGNPIGAVGDAVGSINPVVGQIMQTIGGLIGTIKQNANEQRQLTQRLAVYSPALTRVNVEEDIKDIRQRLSMARTQGTERAQIERETRDLERRREALGLTGWQKIVNALDNFSLSLRETQKKSEEENRRLQDLLLPDKLREELKKDREARARADAAAAAKMGDFNRNLPNPFVFQAHVKGDGVRKEIRNRLEFPAQRPGGFRNPAMPGV